MIQEETSTKTCVNLFEVLRKKNDNKDDEPKQKLFGKSKVEPIMHNNKEKERKDDKGEEDDKDDDGSIVPPLKNHYKQQYSDSDSDSESDSNSDDENK